VVDTVRVSFDGLSDELVDLLDRLAGSDGEDVEDIAADFSLTVDQVRWALAFETSLQAA
jgi:uncharacterized protein (DUF433 family)